MPPPEAPNQFFDLIEQDLLVCQSCRDGIIEVTIRKIGLEEFELRLISFRGSWRCHSKDLISYLEQLPLDTHSQVAIYREHFQKRLRSLLPNGFGLLRLDFSKSRRGRTVPIFSCTKTELLNFD